MQSVTLNKVQHDEYLNDVIQIVLSIFNQEPFTEQPSYIVDMACGDGALLKRIYDTIKTQSARGLILDQQPLRVIGVDKSDVALAQAASSLVQIDHALIHGSDASFHQVLSDLIAVGIDDTVGVLYLHLYPNFHGSYTTGAEPVAVPFDCLFVSAPRGIVDGSEEIEGRSLYTGFVDAARHFASLSRHQRSIVPWTSLGSERKPTNGIRELDLEVRADNVNSGLLSDRREGYLMALAHAGLFPDTRAVEKRRETSVSTRITARLLEHRPYIVRYARDNDVSALAELENQCWTAGSRISVSAIQDRVSKYPEGQLILEVDGKLKGCIYSQRIDRIESLECASFDNVWTWHTPGGHVVQLLSLNIFPDMQDKQFGDQLLEFMLQRCELLSGVDTVIGITRCRDFKKYPGVAMSDYIGLRNERGELLDTVLRFHEKHGAKVCRLIAGYRPNDGENSGNGVLVEYDLRGGSRAVRLDQLTSNQVELPPLATLQASSVPDFIIDLVRERLQKGELESIDLDQPLMEMGLDSADLLELTASIHHEFRIPTTPLFFFEHNTCRKVVRAVVELSEATIVVGGSARGEIEPTPGPLPEAEAPESKPASLDVRGLNHDVAIVGVACRLPGNIENAEQLWRSLIQGDSLVSELPETRWQWPLDIDPFDKDRGIDKGGFLTDISRFDAAFFRVSPHEADLMDPQQRILLELSWQCLEDAGYAPASLRGSKTAVFIGASGSDYRLLIDRSGNRVEAHSGIGTAMSVLPNRISYFYDFCGPSMQIDTACSSSLVAMHEAMLSLQTGKCTQALVGGINIMCDMSTTIAYYRAGMLSKEGICKTFDAEANGYVRSEGAVMLMLKPLDHARRDGDHIYALIKGGAVNHGGTASGLTVPSARAQANLLCEAYENAKIDIKTLGYIETHGTGTSLGDPIEVLGLKLAFARLALSPNPATAWCGLGSLKTNIGHLEAAAGIAGVLKVILTLGYQIIPESLHFRTLNPQIELGDSPFRVVDGQCSWAASDSPRRAGVSSFGSGGTNAHLVLEEYLAPQLENWCSPEDLSPRPFSILLSAKTAQALKEQARLLLSHIIRNAYTNAHLLDLAFTLQAGRDPLEHRFAMIVTSIADLQEKIESFLQSKMLRIGTKDLFVGEVKQGSESLATLSEDEDALSLFKLWFVKGKFSKLLELWVRGVNFNWSSLYEEESRCGHDEPKRLSLPAYPFDRTRHWVTTPEIDTYASLGNPPKQAQDCEKDATNIDQRSLGSASLFVPIWEVWTGDLDRSVRNFAESILVIGGTADQLGEIRGRYARAQTIALDISEPIKQLVDQLESREWLEHIIWIAPPSEMLTVLDDESYLARKVGVTSCFRLAKALLELGYGRRELELTFVTWQTQKIHHSDPVDATHAAVHGLVGSLAKEQERWKIRLVDLSSEGQWPLDEFLRLPPDAGGNAYALRDGEWYRQNLMACSLTLGKNLPYRQAGIYVVVGGAGGIGEAFSESLVRRYKAQVIWIGRRALNDSIQSKIDKLSAYGPTPIYISADATDRYALEGAYRQIKETFSLIHGIVHSAITLLDKSVANMSEERFDRSLSAKVDVCVCMAQVFRQEPLDFVLFFSSVQSFLKSPGQSNYAAGSTFEDAFAHALSRIWRCHVRVMNWGYWGGVGAVANESYRHRMASQGFGSIEADIGTAALDALLSGSFEQLAFVQMNHPNALSGIANGEVLRQLPINPNPDSVAICLLQGRSAQEAGFTQHEADALHGVPDELLTELLYLQLSCLVGVIEWKSDLDQNLLERWERDLHIRKMYERWMKHSSRILNEHIRVHDHAGDGNPAVFSAETLWRRLEEQRRGLIDRPGMSAQLSFVDTALRALPEILTGKKTATDVLFPHGSLELVSRIYRGNPIADYFNETLAEALVTHIQDRIDVAPEKPIKIIEIGAGTGATTDTIVKKLRPYQDIVEEYCYTDVSEIFLTEARHRYKEISYFDYRIFDIEKALAEQSIEVGRYDVVIASNVLHATEDVRRTLRNTKACLKHNGLLLLNELSKNDLFYHLTFGLLEGWWRYTDEAIRISGSPAVSIEQWQRVLDLEGFHSVQFSSPRTHGLGQVVIAATSDGLIRQKGSDDVGEFEESRPGRISRIPKKVSPAISPSVQPTTLPSTVSQNTAYTQTQERVVQRITPILGFPDKEMDAQTDFTEYGVDSILAAKILYELEQEFSVVLSSGTLLEFRTIDELTILLTSAADRPRQTLPINPSAEHTHVEGVSGSSEKTTKDSDIAEMLEGFRAGGVGLEETEVLLNNWMER